MAHYGGMSSRIFINYRREDSPGSAGRLYDRLAEEFPADHLFMDVDAIAPGLDFVSEIDVAVRSCDVLLAIIGRNWLDAKDAEGHRRLDNPDDFVRIEIATALKNKVLVIPVLVDGASMPDLSELPDDLKALSHRQAIELRHNRFAADTQILLKALERGTASPERHVGSGKEPITATAETSAWALPPKLTFAVSATVFAIISSGAIGGVFVAGGGTDYWLVRAGPAVMLWASFNVMIGPALSLKLWVPGLTWRQFLGVVGATFGALLIMVTMQTTLQTLFFPGAEPGLQNTSENILAIGLIELPTSLWTGYVLGYFLAQALRGWFPDGGGAGYVRRMSLIWMGTGALMVFITFPFIMVAEALASRSSDADAVLIARSWARMWADTVLFGFFWGLGLFLTFRFAWRPTDIAAYRDKRQKPDR
jgi:hypothetical protein